MASAPARVWETELATVEAADPSSATLPDLQAGEETRAINPMARKKRIMKFPPSWPIAERIYSADAKWLPTRRRMLLAVN